MIPCPECKRHLRESEIHCPFCGADVHAASVHADAGVRSFGAFALTALVWLGTSACSKDTTANDGNTTTSDGTTTVDESSSTETSTGTDTDDEPTNTSTPSGSFYAPPEDLQGVLECDPWAQDCPEGEKCVPYSSTGGELDANKCVPIYGDGQPGDPCTYGGVVEANDDCDETSHCWDGICTPFCTGTADEPICAEGTGCLIDKDGSVNLCIDACDPLAQDCDDELACYWAHDAFTCTPKLGELAPGEPCSFVDDCSPGGLCAAAELLPECADASCCTSFCSMTMPACPLPGTECVAFFEGDPPAGYEDLGICAAPPP